MSSEIEDEPSSIHDLTERGRERLEDAQAGAKDALSAATEYIRENPWVAVGGAIVAGALIVVLAKPSKPEPSRTDALRDLLDEALAKLPSQKQVQAVAESSGVPDLLGRLRKKLNL